MVGGATADVTQSFMGTGMGKQPLKSEARAPLDPPAAMDDGSGADLSGTDDECSTSNDNVLFKTSAFYVAPIPSFTPKREADAKQRREEREQQHTGWRR